MKIKNNAKQYFHTHGSLLITSDEGIYIILHPNGTVEATGMYKNANGACFTLIKEYENINDFMKAFMLNSLEELKTISWSAFLMME